MDKIVTNLDVDAMSQCIFCTNQLPPSHALQIIENLTRYLRIDRGKLSNGETSKLIVGLCEECAILNKMFCGLFQQLEKIRMELGTCLELIRGKLMKVTDPETGAQPNRFTGSMVIKPGDVDGLRKIILRGCIQKLTTLLQNVSLRAKVKKLTTAQLNRKKIKLMRSSRVKPNLEVTENPSVPVVAMAIKIENANLSEYNGAMDIDDDDESYFPINDGSDDDSNDDSNDEDFNPNFTTSTTRVKSKKSKIEQPLGGRISKSSRNKAMDFVVVTPPISQWPDQPWKTQFTFNPSTNKFKCNFCPKEIKSSRDAYSHFRDIHIRPIYKCSLCVKQFCQLRSYTRHYETVHDGGANKVKCFQCNKLYPDKVSLRRHQKRCGVKKKRHFKKSNQSQSSQPNPDPLADPDIPVEQNVVESATIEGRMNADFDKQPNLGKALEDPEMPKGEIRSATDSIQKVLPQNKYFYRFSLGSLKGLFTMDAKTSRYKCNDCQKEFRCYTGFSKHYSSTHLKLRHTCDRCDTTFTMEYSLRRHQRKSCHPNKKKKIKMNKVAMSPRSASTTKRKREFCNVCGVNFSGKKSFIRHQETCGNLLKKRLVTSRCKFCGKGFPGEHSLKRHLSTAHLKSGGEFKCQWCKETFAIQEDLNGHQRLVHPGDLMKMTMSDLGLD